MKPLLHITTVTLIFALNNSGIEYIAEVLAVLYGCYFMLAEAVKGTLLQVEKHNACIDEENAA